MLRVSVLVVIDVDLWNKSTIYIRKNYIEGFYLFLNKIKKKMRLAIFKRQIFTSTASYIKIKLKKPSRWWSSDKSLELRSLLSLWSQVQALRLLIWWPLEAYMIVNFRARGISWGARKLTRTPTLNLKKMKLKNRNKIQMSWFGMLCTHSMGD